MRLVVNLFLLLKGGRLLRSGETAFSRQARETRKQSRFMQRNDEAEYLGKN